jgi:hypothetical protein
MTLGAIVLAVASLAALGVFLGLGAVGVPPGAGEVVRRRGGVAGVAELLLVVVTAQACFNVQARFTAVFLKVVGRVGVFRRRGVTEIAATGGDLLVVAHRAGLHRDACGLTRLRVGDGVVTVGAYEAAQPDVLLVGHLHATLLVGDLGERMALKTIRIAG